MNTSPVRKGGNPMNTKHATFSASALLIAMSLASPLMAQSQQPTRQLSIGGVPVPGDQLLEVQARCDELVAQRAAAVSEPDTKAPAANMPAAGAGDYAATTESSAEEPVDPTATGSVEPYAAEGNMAADTDAAAGADARIDIASITLELCEEGGFTASAP
jgi:hypothetical protein